MLIVDDLLLGVLASALVAYADRLDNDKAAKKRENAAKLRASAARLRSPADEAEGLLAQAFRDHGTGGVVAKLAEAIGGDPVWGHDLARWMLDPDPDRVAATRALLTARLADTIGESEEPIDAFLGGLHERLNRHPELARLRADRKLSVVLDRLSGIEDLRAIVERNHVYVASTLERVLSQERSQHLVPVSPRYRPASERNGLLRGNRPTDADMDEHVDFERQQFPKVMAAVQEADHFPTAFVIVADAQRGKTTFLKRVGWELAKGGFAVLQLQEASKGESYARWLIEAAEQTPNRPIVVLVDDPHTEREHFESQMITLGDRGTHVICLIASRTQDWNKVETERVPLLREAPRFELDPIPAERHGVLDQLERRGLVQIDSEQEEALREEIASLPVGEGYFQKVIQIASEDRFRPTPVLVRERLAEANGSKEALAFERLYSFACLFGMVGLAMPDTVAQHLLTEEQRFDSRSFSEAMPNPPIRWEGGKLHVTHETHAETHLEGRDLVAFIGEVLERSFEHGTLRGPVGQLLDLLRRRGLEAVALDAWHVISVRVEKSWWDRCTTESFAAWSDFFYNTGQLERALEVCGRAGVCEYDPSPDLFVVTRALYNKGVILGQLDRSEEELAAYDDLLERFGGRDELPLLEWVAKALVSKGVTLDQLDRSEDALAAYDDLLEQFGGRDELPLLEWVAKALVNKGVTLSQLDRSQDALAVYDDLLERFGGRDELPLLEQVAKALYNKGVTLSQLDRSEDALAVYDDQLERFGGRDELPLLEQVAKALYNKGVTLSQLDRSEEELAVYDDLLDRFGGRDEPFFVGLVAQAFTMNVICHLEMASGEVADSPQRSQLLDQAESLIHRHAELTGADVDRDYNYACLLALRGSQDDAALTVLEASLDNGSITTDHVANDADWDTLRDHPTYIDLVKRHAN